MPIAVPVRAQRAKKILAVSKVWKPAGWRDSFLETGWLPQRARFPTLSSLLYRCLGAQNHDIHHEHFDYNYGVDVFMDMMLGTSFRGSAREAALLAKHAAKAAKAR